MFYPVRNNPQRGGYIAIISAIIIMAIVLSVALVFSSSNFLGRFDTLFLEQKDVAREVVKGCLEYGRLKLSQSPSYGGNESKNIGSYSCNILAIESVPGQKILKSTAIVEDRTANLKLTVDATTLKAVSLEEFASF